MSTPAQTRPSVIVTKDVVSQILLPEKSSSMYIAAYATFFNWKILNKTNLWSKNNNYEYTSTGE